MKTCYELVQNADSGLASTLLQLSKYVAQSNSDTSKIDSSSVSSHLDVSILSNVA